MEGGGRVAEAEGHDEWFKEAKGALKSGLPLVAMLYANIVVAPTDVELCKVARALELVDEFRNQGQGSSVFYGDVVEIPVVLNGSEAVALLFDEEKGAGDRRF